MEKVRRTDVQRTSVFVETRITHKTSYFPFQQNIIIIMLKKKIIV